MRSYLINKNLCISYRLGKLIGRKWARRVCMTSEKIILIFGREVYNI